MVQELHEESEEPQELQEPQDLQNLRFPMQELYDWLQFVQLTKEALYFNTKVGSLK